MREFGYSLIEAGDINRQENLMSDLYIYTVFTGDQTVQLEPGHSVWVFRHDESHGPLVSAHGIWAHDTMQSDSLTVDIAGYRPPYRSAAVDATPRLPYINGCSTAQLLPPIRPGDPTWQMLYMPPHTSEQQHHIHSTARVVYVLDGAGIAVIGLGDQAYEETLDPGDVLILHSMVPHHFYTKDSSLIVLPLHIYSTPTAGEHDHPMMGGTHIISK